MHYALSKTPATTYFEHIPSIETVIYRAEFSYGNVVVPQRLPYDPKNRNHTTFGTVMGGSIHIQAILEESNLAIGRVMEPDLPLQEQINSEFRQWGAGGNIFPDRRTIGSANIVYALLIRILMADGNWVDFGLVLDLSGRVSSDSLGGIRLGMFYRAIKPESKMRCGAAKYFWDVFKNKSIEIR
jgi:hypothetical protein